MKLFFLTLLLTTLVSACEISDSDSLRGETKQSNDGKTYLIIADDNGGACGPMLLDGIPWPHLIDEAGEVSSGSHEIQCGGTIKFIIPEATIFTFNYWGP